MHIFSLLYDVKLLLSMPFPLNFVFPDHGIIAPINGLRPVPVCNQSQKDYHLSSSEFIRSSSPDYDRRVIRSSPHEA
ncbi:hypothetical protein L1887_05947 [Cichorium endivia]|nr:hypothetical protein L1887_05947 [Cichorium endivia]